MRSNNKQTGFTLLELMVAVVVFSIMAVMAHGGLKNVIDNSESSRDAIERLQVVQTAISSMSRDLSQIFPRDIVDSFGTPKKYLLADNQSELLVEFTRSGRRNPAGLTRSSLQRVAYRVEEEKLYRVMWRQLDQAQGEEPLQSELLDDVRSLDFRFMDDTGKWNDTWPPLGSGLPGVASPALRAVEFSLELKDWGKIIRLFEVLE